MSDDRPKHRLSSRILLAVVVLATLGVVALCIYGALDMAALRRGSAGPLMQSAPGKDPAPLMMRPSKTP